MSANSNGGPAFPVGMGTGMSLRDYLATQAMQAMITGKEFHDDTKPSVYENHAKRAYKMADAMLKAR